VAESLNNLAALYYAKGQYAQAEPLYRRALAIYENALGLEHSQVATCLNNLAGLYQTQGQYAQAEPLYRRALALREKSLGPEHLDVAYSLNNLAGLYYAQGQYAQAEPHFKRALAIFETALGPEHPNVTQILENYAALLRKLDRTAEAETMEAPRQGDSRSALTPSENFRFLRHARALARFDLPATESSKLPVGQSAGPAQVPAVHQEGFSGGIAPNTGTPSLSSRSRTVRTRGANDSNNSTQPIATPKAITKLSPAYTYFTGLTGYKLGTALEAMRISVTVADSFTRASS
jgi:tetratricopeptide (TPR) repeat protein